MQFPILDFGLDHFTSQPFIWSCRCFHPDHTRVGVM